MQDQSADITTPSPPPPRPGSGPGEAVVLLQGVTRHFGHVAALSDLDLMVPAGAITVLLGPNGAGKTTAIRMITGALGPDAGVVRTFGVDPAVEGESVRTRCGVVSAKPALYDRLSGYDNLLYSAELYGLGRDCGDRIRECAARFGIDSALDQQVGGFSTGMKTRLALSRSILHEPQLLLYDEPTSGLDPESAYAVLELIRQMTTEGRTVVMCTHLLAEAEGLADRIVILENGTDLLAGTHDELVARYWPEAVVRFGAEDPATLDVLATHPAVSTTRREGVLLELQLHDPAAVSDLVAFAVERGVRLTRVDPHTPTLEDLYFAVRRERREQLAADGGDDERPGERFVLAGAEGHHA